MVLLRMIKIVALAVLLLPTGAASAAAWDVGIDQRNAADNSWVVRLLFSPPTDGVMLYNTTTRLPQWVTLGEGLTRDGTVLNYQQVDWNVTSGKGAILNKPTLSAVATSGQYADLAGRPAIPAAQIQSDWNATSGIAAIANRPELSAVATSGSYSDLTNRPALFDGTWASLSGKPAWTGTFTGAFASLSGLPSAYTPAAHTHVAADVASGTFADARIPALAISKTVGLQSALDAKFSIPSGSTSDYVRGDGTVAPFPSLMTSVGSPVPRTVALATAYQCSNPARPCLVTLTLQSQSTISLSGASNNEGAITVGPSTAVSAGTGSNVAVYKNNLGGGLVVGLTITSQQANTYTVALPAGHYFAVRQTAGTGLQVATAFDQQL